MNTIKIILLGDSGVGKSRICHCYTENTTEFNENITIGVEFYVKHYSVKDTLYRIHIWDTAGQEKFRSIVRNYYRRNDSNIIVFDITNIDSIYTISLWLEDLEKNADNKEVFLIANKMDLYIETDEVEKEIERILSNPYIKGFYRVSALTGESIHECMDDIIHKTISYSNHTQLDDMGLHLIEEPVSYSKKHCC